MKPIRKILLGAVILVGLELVMSSCLTDGSRRSGVYYGGQRDPWFHDDSWVDGNRWYGEPRPGGNVEVYIHPPRGRRLSRITGNPRVRHRCLPAGRRERPSVPF